MNSCHVENGIRCVWVYGTTEKMRRGTANFLDIVLAIILPPLGVFLKFGCEVEFWICLLLTLLGYLPGIIYAVYAITK
ncbi:Hydrophobic protein like [Quillaja saponaria]|uniref:Hydrophobic protein like n=1 Tax=Quillaja saponaria TaxID=32244 RepID=A0AAD7VJA4_QUISA|nr:Hydrophobic protein like [Quillaja saponaria]